MLIAQVVGRNEEDRFLIPVLDRLARQVDLIVFTDDASDDDTPNIAESYGAKVLRLESPLFSTHEGELRATAWQHLERFASVNDWILCIDCDELLYAPNLRQWIDQVRWHVLGITFYHMWNATHYRVDKAWAPTISSRLFRFYPGGEYRNRKMACGAEPTYIQSIIQQGLVNWHTGFRMKHLGYLRDEDKILKYKRYMDLDQGNFHSLTHLESILDDHPTLLPWEE